MRIIIAIFLMVGINFSAMASVDVKVYMSSTCPHCQKADAYLATLQKDYNWLKVDKFYIDKDKSALEAFYQQLNALQIEDFSVPAYFFCGSRWVGFDSDEHLGALIKKALVYCHSQQNQAGVVSKTVSETLNQWSRASQIQANIAPSVSPFIMTLFSAFVDAFNPSSLFFIAGLIVYFIVGKRHELIVSKWLILAIILGIHLLQTQAFASLQMMMPLMLGLGVLGIILSLVDNYKPLFYPLGLIAWLLWLGALFNFQQPAFINMPLIFFQWIGQQKFSAFNAYGYLILYQLLYGVFWLAWFKFLTWFSTKAVFKPWHECPQGVLIGYGAISMLLLLFYREGLTNFYLSVVILVIFWAGIFALNQFLLKDKKS